MMRTAAIITVSVLAGMGLGVQATEREPYPTPTPTPTVSCPTEDSCVPVYHHGQWHILPTDETCDAEDASPEWWADGDCARPETH